MLNFCCCIFQTVYGGKVLDPYDRRILFAYLDEYLGDFLFDEFQPFHFYKGNNREQYVIPYAAGSKADFLGNTQHSTLNSSWLPHPTLSIFVTFSKCDSNEIIWIIWIASNMRFVLSYKFMTSIRSCNRIACSDRMKIKIILFVENCFKWETLSFSI